jgi:hypothetical protein
MNNNIIAKIASIIIGLIVSVVVIFMGFRLIQNVFTRAEDMAPRDVVVADIGQNAAKISWSTGIETQGVIEYGTTPTALNFFAPEASKVKNHLVDLTLLSPATTYYFQIRVGDQKFDNGGVPWTFSTKSNDRTKLPETTPSSPAITGKKIQSLDIGGSPAPAAGCTETDCQKICRNVQDKQGRECTVADFMKKSCVGKVNFNTCSLTSISPTATPSGAL